MYVLQRHVVKDGKHTAVRDKKYLTRYFVANSDFRFTTEYPTDLPERQCVYMTAYFFGKYIVTRSVISSRLAYANLHSFNQWDILNTYTGTYHTVSQVIYPNKDYILKAIKRGSLHIRSSLDREHARVWYEV